MRTIRSRVAVAALLLVAVATPAAAHVTVQPNEAATESFARFVVRVPNERDNAATVKVEVQLPETLLSVSFQPTSGWNRTVERKQRSAPVELHGEQVTDYIASVTWEGGRIEPGEFQEFGFSVRTPEAPGTLTFPALQTYDNGEVVRWTGPADAEEPAARVRTFRLEAGQVELLSKLGDDEDDDETEIPVVVPWVALVVAVAALGLALTGRSRQA